MQRTLIAALAAQLIWQNVLQPWWRRRQRRGRAFRQDWRAAFVFDAGRTGGVRSQRDFKMGQDHQGCGYRTGIVAGRRVAGAGEASGIHAGIGVPEVRVQLGTVPLSPISRSS